MSAISASSSSASSTLCTICQQVLKAPTVQLPCKDTFHFLCIEKLKKHAVGPVTCPNCRDKVSGIFSSSSSASSRLPRPTLSSATLSVSPGLPHASRSSAVVPRPSFADDMPPVATTSGRPLASIAMSCTAAIGPEHIEDRNKSFDALVKISTPRVAGASDTPTDVVVVADVSGSMAESDKMPYLKESLKWLVERLTDQHRVSLITFSDDAERKCSLKLMNDLGKKCLADSIKALKSEGGTDIAKGLELAKAVVEERRYTDRATIVMLVTDGKDANPLWLSQSIVRAVASSALCCCIGLGEDHDADLLSTLAKEAKGSFDYCRDADAIAPTIGSLIATATRAAAVGLSLVVDSGSAPRHSRLPLFTEDQEHVLLFTSTLASPPTIKLSYKEVGSPAERQQVLVPNFTAVPASQQDLILVDSHKNREAVAALFQRVAELVKDGRYDVARAELAAMIERLEKSISKGDPLTKTLIENCLKTRSDLNASQESRGSYAQTISVSMSHHSQTPSQALTSMSQEDFYSPSVRTLSSAEARQAVRRTRTHK